MELILVSLLVFVASVVGTVSGFGTSTIMVPVLVHYLGLVDTLLLVGIVHWFGNVWKLQLFRSGLRWRLIFLFVMTGVPMTLLGGWLVFEISEVHLGRALGVLLIAYVVILLLKSGFVLPASATTALGGGAAYGLTAGIFGIGGAVRGAFLAAYDLPKAVYIATTGAIGLAIDSGRLVAYLLGGSRLEATLWWGMLLFIPVSYLGARLGARIVDWIPQRRFRQVIAAFLILVALQLIVAP